MRICEQMAFRFQVRFVVLQWVGEVWDGSNRAVDHDVQSLVLEKEVRCRWVLWTWYCSWRMDSHVDFE